jgi:DNA-binding CsgD family transcriptional regulator
MDGTAADLFENAARYEPELTDRQRDVMRLIAAGKTNGEIADALDMTLAGAKWHVSELLVRIARIRSRVLPLARGPAPPVRSKRAWVVLRDGAQDRIRGGGRWGGDCGGSGGAVRNERR